MPESEVAGEPSDPSDDPTGPAHIDARIEAWMRDALHARPDSRRDGFVCSELSSVRAALQAVLDKDMARGPVFCEWGSGLGAVCAVASSLQLEVYGIEIQGDLVDGARELVAGLELPAEFAHGSFLLPGDEELIAGCDNTHAVTSRNAYDDLGLSPSSSDIVFAYPWPGEEAMHDRVFERHATAGALLLTYHENSRVLVQRHMGAGRELAAVEWVG